MKKLVVLFMAAVTGTALLAASGDSEANAVSIKVGGSQAVTLVEDADFAGVKAGAYYLKTTLRKGTAYIIWIEGGDAAKIGYQGISAYPYEGSDWSGDWGDDSGDDWSFDDSGDDWGGDWGGGWGGGSTKDPPTASFTDSGVQGDRQAIWMAEDDWSSDDPSSWTYYIKLSGDIGQSTTVSVSVSPYGARNRPEEITMETAANSFSGYFVENGFFYFQSVLTAGRKYFVRTQGGQKAEPFDIQFVQASGLRLEPDTGKASAGNAAYVVYPDVSGDFTFAVSNSAEEAGTQFGLVYEAYPARSVASHPSTNIFEGTWVKFRPGREVADPDFYDNIIDERLFRVTARAGERWVCDAMGADRPIEMRFYGPSGEILGSQASPGNGAFDVRSGFDVPESGDYYIGVCDPALSPTDTVVCAETRLKAYRVEAADGEPVEIQPKAVATNEIADVTAVGTKVGPCVLNDRCWSQNFLISGRKNITYAFATKGEAPTNLTLKAELFKMSGTTEIRSPLLDGNDLTPGKRVAFTANANATFLLRLSVAEGKALDFPSFELYSVGCDLKKGGKLGTLTVNTYPGNFGGWKLDNESTKYTGETVSILVTADVEHKVKFSSASDFTAPGERKFTIAGMGGVTNVTGRYYDRYDPEDDTADGAKLMMLGASLSTRNRTLWADVYDGNKADPADWFAFAAVEGVYYNFYLDKLSGDARMTIYKPDAKTPISPAFDGVTEVAALQLDDYGGAGTYYVCVKHGTETTNWVDSAYAFKASAADVGLVGFAKTTASAKKSAGTVKVTVNRTTDEGHIRVRYATKADTAVPGKDYVAQSGILEWGDGEKDAKTVEIELLPDLVARKGETTVFSVVLTALAEAELQKGEYPATVDPLAASCTVTLSSGGKYASIEAAYAKSKGKVATTKTEQVPLNTGTFYGVLDEDGTELTNGLPRIASVTVTAKDGGDVSASVVIGGKKYAFKGAGSWEDVTNGLKRVTLPISKGTGTMTVVLQGGRTDDEGAWMAAGGSVEVEMDVPDVKGKGSQADIRYIGRVYRQNAKIQDYLTTVAKFYGYYTVALVPEGVTSLDGIPAGNGYLTVKVDAKGTAKVAGLLADGTKVSVSVKAAAVVADTNSVLGVSMVLPVFQSKSPYCFGGTLRLFARPGATTVDPNKTDHQIVVDSTDTLTWNNDNAALTYDNVSGWRLTCVPVGGWYDTVVNLEAYYIGYALAVGTADITEFPSELVSDGYHIVTTVQPNGLPFAFNGDKVAVPKKKLVKNESKLYNLVDSINPCDVKIKFKRATGIVNGSFSVWSANDELGKQKVVKGFKHNGVLLLLRDDFALMGDNVASAGFFTQKVTLQETKIVKGREKNVKRKWTLSLPFNLLATDPGDIDWWADDAGWNPDWGAEPQEPEEMQ